MATGDKILAGGIPGAAARAIVGDVLSAQTAVGATQATALAIAADNTFISTAAASTGVVLPPGNQGDMRFIYNGGANTVSVYPPLGGTINNLSANTAFSVATLKSAIAVCAGGLTWAVMLGA